MNTDRFLCKAKRIVNKDWIVGFYFKHWDNAYLLWGMENGKPSMAEVFPNTVCQCTGLKDKNDKLIFENDVVKVKTRITTYKGVVKNYANENYPGFDIDFEDNRCTMGKVANISSDSNLLGYYMEVGTIEVIGNIHDKEK